VRLSFPCCSNTLDGFLVTLTPKPETGVLTAVECPLSAANRQGSVIQVEVKTKTGSGKASFKGTLMVIDELHPQVAVCNIRAKRYDTTPQVISSCPM
jgi:hypothetical protein